MKSLKATLMAGTLFLAAALARPATLHTDCQLEYRQGALG